MNKLSKQQKKAWYDQQKQQQQCYNPKGNTSGDHLIVCFYMGTSRASSPLFSPSVKNGYLAILGHYQISHIACGIPTMAVGLP